MNSCVRYTTSGQQRLLIPMKFHAELSALCLAPFYQHETPFISAAITGGKGEYVTHHKESF